MHHFFYREFPLWVKYDSAPVSYLIKLHFVIISQNGCHGIYCLFGIQCQPCCVVSILRRAVPDLSCYRNSRRFQEPSCCLVVVITVIVTFFGLSLAAGGDPLTFGSTSGVSLRRIRRHIDDRTEISIVLLFGIWIRCITFSMARAGEPPMFAYVPMDFRTLLHI